MIVTFTVGVSNTFTLNSDEKLLGTSFIEYVPSVKPDKSQVTEEFVLVFWTDMSFMAPVIITFTVEGIPETS